MKADELMIGDWVQDEQGFRYQIEDLGCGYGYATFLGNKAFVWRFDYKDAPCYGIPLDDVREQVEAVTEITGNFKFLHEFQHYLRVMGRSEEERKIRL